MIAPVTPLHNIFLCHIHTNTTSLINPDTHQIILAESKGKHSAQRYTAEGGFPGDKRIRELDEGFLHSPSSIAGEELIPGVQPP